MSGTGPDRWISGGDVVRFEQRSERWLHLRAKDLGVRRDKAVGRNGKPVPVYDAMKMSPEAQKRWAAAQNVLEMPAPAGEDAEPAQLLFDLALGGEVTDAEEAEARRRLEIIAPLTEPSKHRSLWSYCGGRKTAVVQELARLHGVSKSTLYQWWSRFKDGGVASLADGPRADKGKTRRLNQAAKDLIVALVTPDPRRRGSGARTVRQAYEAYDQERLWRESLGEEPVRGEDAERLERCLDSRGRLKPEALLPRISYSTFRNWVNKLPQPYLVAARGGPKKFWATEEMVTHRDYEALDPLAFVVMDHRQLDVFAMRQERGRWKLIRPWITAAMDMRTRRWLGWVVVEQPDSNSIATVLKQVLVRHGRPRRWYWDNGQDFECEWLNAVLLGLGTDVTHSLVENARAKSIEANFRRLSEFEKQLPWWVGHKAEARPEQLAEMERKHARWIGGKEPEPAFLTLEEAAELYGRLIEDLNETPHSGTAMTVTTPEGRRRLTPNECWRRLAGRIPKEEIRWETLLFLFRERRRVKVAQGRVKLTFGGRQYIYEPAAGADPMAFLQFNGRAVDVAVDRLDLSLAAVFYERRLVAIAQNLELRGVGEELFKEDEKQRRRARKMYRDLVKLVREQSAAPTPVELLERRRRERQAAAEVERPRVAVAFPDAERGAAAMQTKRFAAAGRAVARVEIPADEGDEFDFFGG